MTVSGGHGRFLKAVALGCLLACFGATSAMGYQGRTFFDDKRSFFGWVRHVEGNQIGEVEPFSAVGGTGMFLADNGVWTVNAELLVSNEGDAGGSVGVGRRFWLGSDTIAGATLSYEANKSPYDNLFRQAVFSMEGFRKSWSVRANGYAPLGTRIEEAMPPTFAGSEITFSGNNLVTASDISRIDEASMGGFDVEFARDLGSARAEVFVGYSRLDGDIGDDASGPKLGARAWLTPRLTADFTVSDDDLFGTNVFGGLTWTFGGPERIPRTLEDKLIIPVERNTQVAVNPVDTTVAASTVLTDQGSGIVIAHVRAGGAGGIGTFEDPYSSLGAAAGETADIVYVASGSVFNGEDYRLRQGQSLIGEGDAAVHSVMTDQLGLIQLPEINGINLARPVINGAPGAAISLAGDTYVSNFDILNSGTGIEADNLSGAALVERVRITGGFTGIDVIAGIGQLSFIGVDIDDAVGVAFNVNGGSSSVTFEGDIDKNGAGSAVEVTNHSGGTLDFRNGTIQVTDGTGLQFNNADGAYNFDGTLNLNGGDAGIDILGNSNGTFRFADASIIDPLGEALNVNGGSASVTYSGDMIKNSGGSTISITNHAGGMFTFDGGSIQVTDGSGLQFNNTDGIYNFDGNLTLNGGDAGIDILGNSNGTFTFSDASIIDPTGTAFNLNGGGASVSFLGNITKNNSGSTIAVTNHTGGSLNFGSGAISATAGSGLQFNNADGSYRFDGTVTLNGGDAGVDILGDSNGDFVFADATIVDPTGTAFNVNGGSAGVSYNGSITKNSLGSALAITNHTGGAITFSNGTISATNGTGLLFNSADGSYVFNGIVTLNGGDAGIDILGSSNGTFRFEDTTIINPSGTAFNVVGLGPDGDIDFNGSITNDNDDLITIRGTTAGSTIHFNDTGANSLSGDGGGGILIVDADGDVTVTTPTTIVNPTNAFALTGVSVVGGTGTIRFTDTTVELPSGLGGLLAAVRVDSQNGTVSFANLDILTNSNGAVGLSVVDSNRVEVSGLSTIDTTGGDAIDLSNVADVEMSFESVSASNSQSGFGNGNGIRLVGIGGGTIDIAATAIDGTTAAGIEIDDSLAAITFESIDVRNTGGDGLAVGLTSGNGGSVTVSGGTMNNIGGSGIHADGAAGLTVNDVEFAVIGGFVVDVSGSTLSGTGNLAAPFSCNDGGGNSGQLLFNDGADGCP